MKETMNSLAEQNVTSKEMLITKLETKIQSPPSEVRADFEQINREIQSLFGDIQMETAIISDDVSDMKDLISKTFNLVADVRYRVT